MIKILSIANQKGGVGKTTTAVNLSAALAGLGKSVLLIDLDPQANATMGSGVEKSSLKYSVYHMLLGLTDAASILKKTQSGYDLLPSNRDLIGAEIELTEESRREYRLKDALEKIFHRYEFILIDCPPSLSLLTIMALVASGELLVPLQTEFFALEGITQLVKTIDRIKVNLNPDLKVRGILLTMFDKRNKLSSQVDKEARNYFKEKVYKTVIPRNVRLSEAPSHGLPCVIYDKTCLGSKSYLKLANEFMDKKNLNVESAA